MRISALPDRPEICIDPNSEVRPNSKSVQTLRQTPRPQSARRMTVDVTRTPLNIG
jgi:hypothetical protein